MVKVLDSKRFGHSGSEQGRNETRQEGRSPTQDLFCGLSKKEIAVCTGLAEQQTRPAGSFFFHAGEQADDFYLLQSGRVKICQTTASGRSVLSHFAIGGEIFGISTLLQVPTHAPSAQAVDESAALMWKRQVIKKLMHDIPPLAWNITKIMAHYWHEILEKHVVVSTERVEQRVAWVLVQLQKQIGCRMPSYAWPQNGPVQSGNVMVLQGISEQDLADMAGTTNYTVSRILTRWEQTGAVMKRRRTIFVRQPEKIARLANLPA